MKRTCSRIHQWKWSETVQWPPLSYVRDADLWRLPIYEQLRKKLKSPVPTPEISAAEGGFLTVTANKVLAADEEIPKDRYLCVCCSFLLVWWWYCTSLPAFNTEVLDCSDNVPTLLIWVLLHSLYFLSQGRTGPHCSRTTGHSHPSGTGYAELPRAVYGGGGRCYWGPFNSGMMLL